MPWFNSPGQQGGGMWGGNGPQAPQINNAPQGSMWGGPQPGTLGQIGGLVSRAGVLGGGLFGGLFGGGGGHVDLATLLNQRRGQMPAMPQLPSQAPMQQPPAYGAGGRWGAVPGNEQWQRGPGSGIWEGPFGGGENPQGFPQPTGPREAPEAHPGWADQQAGQWASPMDPRLIGGTLSSIGRRF